MGFNLFFGRSFPFILWIHVASKEKGASAIVISNCTCSRCFEAPPFGGARLNFLADARPGCCCTPRSATRLHELLIAWDARLQLEIVFQQHVESRSISDWRSLKVKPSTNATAGTVC